MHGITGMAAVGFLLLWPLATLAYAQAVEVAVDDNAFDPASVTVAAGGTVTWEHVGGNPHTVTASDGSFDSSPGCGSFADSATGACLDSGETFSFTFEEPGTYAYYCRLHGTSSGTGMAGTVVVEAAPEDDGSGADPGSADPGSADDGSTDDDTQDDGTADDTAAGDADTGGDDTAAADDGAESTTDAGSLPRTGISAVLLGVVGVTVTGAGWMLVRRRPRAG